MSEVFAENTADHMLTGKAYAKAVRAHMLIQVSLARLVFEDLKENDPIIKQSIEDFTIMDLYEDASNVETLLNDPDFQYITDAFEKKLEDLAKNNKTWSLWVLYFRMVSILKDSIYADRSGDWELHLSSMELMIPFFHVCGHFPYAKAATLYIQDMKELKKNHGPRRI